MKWELKTDERTYTNKEITFNLIRKLIRQVKKGRRKFLILIPSKLIQGSDFIQTAYDKKIGFLLEISLAIKNGGNLLLNCYPAPENQVIEAFSLYFDKRELYPYSGWEIKNIYRVNSSWNSNSNSLRGFGYSRKFNKVKEFVQFVKEGHKNDSVKFHWHWKRIMVSYPKIILKFPIKIQYPVPSLDDDVIKSDESIVEADGCTKEADWKALKKMHEIVLSTELKADDGISFTEGELLMKIHNRLAGRLQDENHFKWFALNRTESCKSIPEFKFKVSSY